VIVVDLHKVHVPLTAAGGKYLARSHCVQQTVTVVLGSPATVPEFAGAPVGAHWPVTVTLGLTLEIEPVDW